jgi:outer membrane biosynthesis protein TonB
MKKLHKAVIGILGGFAVISSAGSQVKAVDVSHGYGDTPKTNQNSYEDTLAVVTNVTRTNVNTAVSNINLIPSAKPTATPTAKPSSKPTATPTPKISSKPTATPTPKISSKPTATPTSKVTPKLTPGSEASPSPKLSPKETPTPEPKPSAKVTSKASEVATTVMSAFTQTYRNIFQSLSSFFRF